MSKEGKVIGVIAAIGTGVVVYNYYNRVNIEVSNINNSIGSLDYKATIGAKTINGTVKIYEETAIREQYRNKVLRVFSGRSQTIRINISNKNNKVIKAFEHTFPLIGIVEETVEETMEETNKFLNEYCS